MEKQKENVEIRVLKWERAWNNDIGFFFRKNEIKYYFYEMGRTSYESQLLNVLFF